MKKNIFLTLTILFLVFGIFGNIKFAKAGCCVGTPKVTDIASGWGMLKNAVGTGNLPEVSCAEPNSNSDNPCPPEASRLIREVTNCEEGSKYLKEQLGSGCKKPIIKATVASACCVGASTCSQTTSNSCADGSAPVQKDCSEIDACKNSSAPTSTNTIEFANPIGFNSFSGLLSSVLSNLMGLIAILAVIFIVIGGILYITSGGNETRVTQAKKTWTGAVIGLAIALSAPTFLQEIQSILNKNANINGNADNWVANALSIKEIAVNVLNFLLSVFGILATIALVIGGVMYLTAYGDEKKIDEGKKIFRYAIIGIVVSLSALIIVRQIGNILGAKMN